MFIDMVDFVPFIKDYDRQIQILIPQHDDNNDNDNNTM